MSERTDSPSVAVLPFTNRSRDKDRDYFSEGMAEEILNALSRVEGLRVAARGSAFQFRAGAQDLRRAGEALGVASLLQGSVETSESRLRVEARLFDAAGGRELWSVQYDGAREDVFAIQDEIVRKVVETLGGGTTPPAPGTRSTSSFEAYDLYLKGRHHWYSRHEGGLNIAIGLFELARAKDPQFALAHAGLADAYSVLGFFGFLPPKVAFPRSKAAIDKALSQDPNLAQAHAGLGLIRWCFDWDWTGAELELKRAIELNPAYVIVYSWYGLFLASLGREDEAREMIAGSLGRDPLSPYAHALAGNAFRLMRQYDLAIRECERALEIDPHFLLGMWFLGLSLGAAGTPEKAAAVLDKVANLSARFPLYVGCHGWACSLAGRKKDAESVLNELLARWRQDHVPVLALVYVCTGLRDKDQALQWLEESYRERGGFLFFAKTDPLFDPLRNDPRFDELLRRMKLAT